MASSLAPAQSPDVWIPPIIGRFFIAHETREKFHELRDEILRRKQAAAGR